MYCSHCGAKLADDAKFCNECGAKLASPASPAVPSVSPATPPVSPSAPPASVAAQTGFPQGSYPPPQGGYPQGQPGYPAPRAAQPSYPYAGQPAAVPPKKKHTALIVVLVLLALIPVALVLLFVLLRLRYEEPPLPVPDLTTVEAFVSETAEPPADATTVIASPSGETTAPAATDAPQDAALSDAQARQALERLCGFWNNEDNTQFIGISQVDGGGFYFTSGYWYSEADLVGYLQGPATGDPAGKITLRLYYEGYESENFSMPAQDGEIVFDLSQADASVLTWEYGGFSQQMHFAGDTMEQALPPMD